MCKISCMGAEPGVYPDYSLDKPLVPPILVLEDATYLAYNYKYMNNNYK